VVVVVMGVVALSIACDDEQSSTDPAVARGASVTGSQDYTWANIQLNGFSSVAELALRAGYWSATELTEDPQARVTRLSASVFRLDFMALRPGIFSVEQARILLQVESATTELQGIVVLCDSTGPIILAPECAGDCAPLCGLPGHDCNG